VNEGENYAVMDPWSAQRLADAQTGLHASDQLVRTAWENAQIPTNFGGIRALMSNGLTSRTQGAFGGTLTVKTQPTVTYNAVK
ncbi:P22 phage major capsid protein family protein, partial [Shigella flexneri]